MKIPRLLLLSQSPATPAKGSSDDDATRTRSVGRPRCAGGRLLRRPHLAGGGEFPDQRHPDLDLSGPDRGPGLDQDRRGEEQPRTRIARRQTGRRHRRRRGGSAGRRVARPVRGRRHPGRRRHLHQHERQRSDREPRAGAARPAQGRLQIPAPQRARQHEPEHQRRLSDGAQARRLRRHHAAGRSHGGAARGVRAQVRRVQGHHQDGPHPVAGRGADDAGAGILHLCRHAGRRRAAAEGSRAAGVRNQHGRDRDRHRHQLASGLCRSGVPASALRHRHSRGDRDQPGRGDAGLRHVSCSSPACSSASP